MNIVVEILLFLVLMKYLGIEGDIFWIIVAIYVVMKIFLGLLLSFITGMVKQIKEQVTNKTRKEL